MLGTFGLLRAFQKSVLTDVNKMGFHHLLPVYNGVLKRQGPSPNSCVSSTHLLGGVPLNNPKRAPIQGVDWDRKKTKKEGESI